ncbi:Asp-tRNA(Asn)/Glu-tRNA(Gln) amidotransferase subunit GatC [Methanolapillus millepedarum]|uniref:Glutamyl-tRNA(Gln) amidotransferase subunit C n=1 Tax=Methanolapillus millepedarum TaxID=3028296 RepID=A0AA96V4U1_9EURY|nr:Glutamyl-tRNA(Gln) amidotransferase subunit C [Methanosarcinaceae archaeon Ac7]
MIQKDETKTLAWAARIAVKDEDIPEFCDKLNQKMDSYSILGGAPTDGVKMTVNPSKLATVLRKDVVVPSMSVEEALKNAPETYETSFKIPKIL